MLSRTAANLYWLGRYTERAENLSRIVEAGYRMTQTPDLASGSCHDEWRSFSVAAACEEGLMAKHGTASLESVIAYVGLDADNPSSIHASLKNARTNARAVRTALTSEVWESLNDTWLEFDGRWQSSLSPANLLNFLDWLKTRVTLIRGTMLRDDAFSFVNVGTHIERADNMARILDVKYHILLPPGENLGGSVDYYQRATLLRSVSALSSYHWMYRDTIKPWLVTELLILREEMPRSLRHSLSQVQRYLEAIADGHGDRKDCQRRRAGQLYAQLSYDTIEDVYGVGLHEYLSGFLSHNNALGAEIAENFHF